MASKLKSLCIARYYQESKELPGLAHLVGHATLGLGIVSSSPSWVEKLLKNKTFKKIKKSNLTEWEKLFANLCIISVSFPEHVKNFFNSTMTKPNEK